MYRKRYACGYKVFARRGDERREERMEEDPCHSVIGERTVPYRAVPCCIVSLCIVSSSTCKILSLPALWFVFLFLTNSRNNEIFVVLHVENTGLNGKPFFPRSRRLSILRWIRSFALSYALSCSVFTVNWIKKVKSEVCDKIVDGGLLKTIVYRCTHVMRK